MTARNSNHGGHQSHDEMVAPFLFHFKEREFAVKEKISKNMTGKVISAGTVHKTPADLREALTSNTKALVAWESLTPLARNEWIRSILSKRAKSK